ncbi:MAG: hypothetical protein ACQERT_12305 [Thermodesulfobacteriota bacterium]
MHSVSPNPTRVCPQEFVRGEPKLIGGEKKSSGHHHQDVCGRATASSKTHPTVPGLPHRAHNAVRSAVNRKNLLSGDSSHPA